MLEEWQQSQPRFCEEVQTMIGKNKKLSHAYFIETNGYEKGMELVISFVKYLFSQFSSFNQSEQEKMSFQIDKETYPDFYLIKPDGSFIKKEQLLNLQDRFKTKSLTNGLRIYLVAQADKLNVASSNTMLKFLEEPEENIVGILVANNRYQVLPTILSRCQIFSLRYEFSPVWNEEKYRNLETFLQVLKHHKKGLIAYENEFVDKLFSSKEETLETFYDLRQLLILLLERKNGKVTKEDVIHYNECLLGFQTKELTKLIQSLYELEKDLTYNVNLKIWLTKFYLKLGEVIL